MPSGFFERQRERWRPATQLQVARSSIARACLEMTDLVSDHAGAFRP
jgi:hypothetical protein